MKKLSKLSLLLLTLLPMMVYASSGKEQDLYDYIGIIFIQIIFTYAIGKFIEIESDKSSVKRKPLYIVLAVTVLVADIIDINTALTIEMVILVLLIFSLPIILVTRGITSTIQSSKIQNIPTPETTEVKSEPNDTTPIVSQDKNYIGTDDSVVYCIVRSMLAEQKFDPETIITKDNYKKQTIALAVFLIITLISTLLYYFNYPLYICIIIELVAYFTFVTVTNKFKTTTQLLKTLKKEPDKEIELIISEIKNDAMETTLSLSKKLWIGIVSIILIVTAICIKPHVLYTKYGDGYQVYKYTRGLITEDKVTIPSEYKGKKVLAIGESAFKRAKIEEVELPDTIESIKYKAFYKAKKLTKINLPDSLEEIRAKAFFSCTQLKNVEFPEGLREIRSSAFAYDTNITEVDLPSTLEYLGAYSFRNTSISSIVIPEKVIEINGGAFAYCNNLKDVTLHDDIISIHGETFMYTAIEYINLPPKITEVRGDTFSHCYNLKEIVIPEGVTRIGGHAFEGCSALKNVTIPSTLREIGSSAFRSCSSLMEIVLPQGVSINERAFKESPTQIKYRRRSDYNYGYDYEY